MILTGQAIRKAYESGEIVINPFDFSQLNPNSYNFRVGQRLLVAKKHTELNYSFDEIEIPHCGFVLQPKILYLAATHEILGSNKYAMTLLGRSSLGRLGLFLNITADLGHTGSISQWTLELTVVQPLKIYPHMKIGQIAFWKSTDSTMSYCGKYNHDTGPESNKDLSLNFNQGKSY